MLPRGTSIAVGLSALLSVGVARLFGGAASRERCLDPVRSASAADTTVDAALAAAFPGGAWRVARDPGSAEPIAVYRAASGEEWIWSCPFEKLPLVEPRNDAARRLSAAAE